MPLIKTDKPIVEMALRMKRMSDYAGRSWPEGISTRSVLSSEG